MTSYLAAFPGYAAAYASVRKKSWTHGDFFLAISGRLATFCDSRRLFGDFWRFLESREIRELCAIYEVLVLGFLSSERREEGREGGRVVFNFSHFIAKYFTGKKKVSSFSPPSLSSPLKTIINNFFLEKNSLHFEYLPLSQPTTHS